MIKAEIKDYLNYGKVIVISNGIVEAYITVDIGPRIIRYGFVGGRNIMNDNRAAVEPKDDKAFEKFYGIGKKWEILGGHRIWISPENYPNSYYPDLDPVKYEITAFGAVFTPNAEIENGVQKQLEIKMSPDDSNMYVTMHVTNIANKPQEFSVWGLTVAATEGTLIIPMNKNDTVLLANRNISVWPYTNLADERLKLSNRYVTLRQDRNISQALKLGFDLNEAKLYYLLGDDIFVKQYETHHPYKKYPDNNCSFETYTCDTFIEIESLSPLEFVEPNKTLSLTEHWSLYKNTSNVQLLDEQSIEEIIRNL